MVKVFWTLLLIVCIVGGVWYWAHRSSDSALTNGEVKETGTGEVVKVVPEDVGEPNRSSPQTPLGLQPSANGTTMPMQLTGQTQTTVQPTTVQPVAMQPTTVSSSGYIAAPAADSIDRNPPNGMVFAGTGPYQVYRQGDLTWRLNTQNGQACIIFATDSEWRKARVYHNGCRGKS
jgi:hypothetical protein